MCLHRVLNSDVVVKNTSSCFPGSVRYRTKATVFVTISQRDSSMFFLLSHGSCLKMGSSSSYVVDKFLIRKKTRESVIVNCFIL